MAGVVIAALVFAWQHAKQIRIEGRVCEARGKRVRLRHLSADCRGLLKRAGSKAEIDPVHDPRYHPAVNQLG